MNKVIKRFIMMLVLAAVAFSTTGLYFFRDSSGVISPVRSCVDGVEFLLGVQHADITQTAKIYLVPKTDAVSETDLILEKEYTITDLEPDERSMLTEVFVERWDDHLKPGQKILISYLFESSSIGGKLVVRPDYNLIVPVEDCSIDDDRPDEKDSYYICENGADWGRLLKCSTRDKSGIDQSPLYTQLTIDEDIIIGDINVGFSIYQKNVGSLKTRLISPHNSTLHLFENVGGLGDHMGLFQCNSENPSNCRADFADFTLPYSAYAQNLNLNTIQSRFPYFYLDDASHYSLENSRSAFAPFERTSFKPEDSFQELIGSNAKGDWTLVIEQDIDHWIHESNGFMADAPPANGNLTATKYEKTVDGLPVRFQNIYYRGEDNQIHNLIWSGAYWGTQQWQHNPIGKQTGAAPVASSPASYALSNGDQAVFYRGQDDHIHALFWNDSASQWSYESLGQDIGAAKANGRPQAHFSEIDGTRNVYYRGLDHQIHELFYDGSRWHYLATGQWIGAPLADDSPSSFKMSNGDQHVFYMGRDEHMHDLYWDRSLETWSHVDLTALTGAAMAASEPTSHFSENDNTMNVFYRGKDNNLHELFHDGSRWHYLPTGQSVGAPKIKGIPSSYKDPDGTQHVYFRGQDNRVHDLYWNGTRWIHTAAGQQAGGPQAAGNPIGTYFDGEGAQTVFYRGQDNQVHHLFLFDPNALEEGELWNWLIDIEPMAAAEPELKINGSTQNLGEYLGPVSIDLTSDSSPAATAVISYTLDGSDPDRTSPTFNGTVHLDVTNGRPSQTFTIKARACCSGYAESEIMEGTITIWAEQAAAPTFSMTGDQLTTDQFRNEVSITLASSTSGSVVRYTLDGSEPTETSPRYNGSPLVFKLAEGEDQKQIIINSKTFRSDYMDSPVSTQNLTLTRNFTIYVPIISR